MIYLCTSFASSLCLVRHTHSHRCNTFLVLIITFINRFHIHGQYRLNVNLNDWQLILLSLHFIYSQSRRIDVTAVTCQSAMPGPSTSLTFKVSIIHLSALKQFLIVLGTLFWGLEAVSTADHWLPADQSRANNIMQYGRRVLYRTRTIDPHLYHNHPPYSHVLYAHLAFVCCKTVDPSHCKNHWPFVRSGSQSGARESVNAQHCCQYRRRFHWSYTMFLFPLRFITRCFTHWMGASQSRVHWGDPLFSWVASRLF